jgi:hypothetical protein
MGHTGDEQPHDRMAWGQTKGVNERPSHSDGPKSAFLEKQPFWKSTLHGLGEIREKLVCQFLGRTIDQALPELGELAADLRLDIICQ